MATTVVHIRDSDHDVYIGRASPRRGLSASPFANPFVIGRDGDAEDCVEMYRIWLYLQPELMWKARRVLRGKVLGCWCKPEACHGDVLAEVADGDDFD